MAPRPPLHRLGARPDQGMWAQDELVSLAEAAALFFPMGPLSAAALRIAVARGELEATSICGTVFTTPQAIGAMTSMRRRQAEGSPPYPRPEPVSLELPPELRDRVVAAARRHPRRRPKRTP